jgi:hypothetical protein
MLLSQQNLERIRFWTQPQLTGQKKALQHAITTTRNNFGQVLANNFVWKKKQFVANSSFNDLLFKLISNELVISTPQELSGVSGDSFLIETEAWQQSREQHNQLLQRHTELLQTYNQLLQEMDMLRFKVQVCFK